MRCVLAAFLLLFLPTAAFAQIYEAEEGQTLLIRVFRFDLPQCSDGIDNDGDGFVDFPEDPDCESPEDNNESTPPPSPGPSPAAQPRPGTKPMPVPVLPLPTPPLPPEPLCPAIDFNCDGRVNIVDLSILLYWWGRTGPEIAPYDLNKDGRIGIVDASILFYYWTG